MLLPFALMRPRQWKWRGFFFWHLATASYPLPEYLRTVRLKFFRDGLEGGGEEKGTGLTAGILPESACYAYLMLRYARVAMKNRTCISNERTLSSDIVPHVVD